MKALLTNYHQSPRKVRLVADLIRGKSVGAARAALLYLPKKSSPAIGKLLDSAVANASSRGSAVEDLFVKTITVNKGIVMRRARPFGRGRSGSLRKTMSIVFLELGVSAKAVKPAKARAAKKTTKKAAAAK
ncbi:50S ribosomal protein L22 [Candidatus Kaiserbacteria bacterium RIFCSPHIGHO2_02_FULL_54_11b]|uniref:Large ribosomal subunit protein uL22 n=2 Tax=Candidatus Kaiseribacteriota TaxID=1752734 RepID=A0A1F6CRZ2_9BACT|nr:MAG: 50S ribosomal protein L22 [Candidatus Kaiserbacteria bacterium RIFCSPHIGHO2_01_FULL_54_36b]OGG63933.1 MAG: 50S ribosomal protein L22 [Candidatus Kaiserbacteria bacterium RIFCSPHIGHO2_02_FULL_54_11b]